MRAEGYARSTGKVGVMLVTSGPGATNAVTPLQDALMDSIPLVCITGQVPTHADRLRRLPGMRHRRHHAALHQAQLAGEGRQRAAAHHPRGVPHRRHHRPPGPVVVDIPKDVQFATGTYTPPEDRADPLLPAEAPGRSPQDQARRSN
jgi:acetolactate synthase-1/2/3 large subunit